MKRLFIGIPIESSKAVQQLDVWKKDSQLNRNVVNWTPPGNWHITLFFLGSTEKSAVPVLKKLIDESFEEIQVCPVELKGVGVFPNTNNPKVLWLGLESLERQMPGYTKLGKLLQQNGFSFDQKPMKPHLTIARVKRADNPSAFQSLLAEYQKTVFDHVVLNKVVLFESITTPTGPVYKPLFGKQLAG